MCIHVEIGPTKNPQWWLPPPMATPSPPPSYPPTHPTMPKHHFGKRWRPTAHCITQNQKNHMQYFMLCSKWHNKTQWLKIQWPWTPDCWKFPQTATPHTTLPTNTQSNSVLIPPPHINLDALSESICQFMVELKLPEIKHFHQSNHTETPPSMPMQHSPANMTQEHILNAFLPHLHIDTLTANIHALIKTNASNH